MPALGDGGQGASPVNPGTQSPQLPKACAQKGPTLGLGSGKQPPSAERKRRSKQPINSRSKMRLGLEAGPEGGGTDRLVARQGVCREACGCQRVLGAGWGPLTAGAQLCRARRGRLPLATASCLVLLSPTLSSEWEVWRTRHSVCGQLSWVVRGPVYTSPGAARKTVLRATEPRTPSAEATGRWGNKCFSCCTLQPLSGDASWLALTVLAPRGRSRLPAAMQGAG